MPVAAGGGGLSHFARPEIRARIETRTGLEARINADVVDGTEKGVELEMAQAGYAVAAYREGGAWRCDALPGGVLDDLGVLLASLRSQPPEGGPFVVACVDDEFFLIARAHGPRIDLLLSDLTASVEFPLAAQVLDRLGEDPPEDDELDEVWPIGELDLFSDLELGEEEMEAILDDLDAYPEEMLDTVIARIGLEEEFSRARTVAGRVPS
ncbi:MAG TPA: tRNA adenosine deaminase-associated protein [Jatrophihabitans sp.]|nr:tRNA adenosine deaminase-associated protein [Jatrophihabitans sp.]